MEKSGRADDECDGTWTGTRETDRVSRDSSETDSSKKAIVIDELQRPTHLPYLTLRWE